MTMTREELESAVQALDERLTAIEDELLYAGKTADPVADKYARWRERVREMRLKRKSEATG